MSQELFSSREISIWRKYEDMSRLSIDKHDRTVIEENEELIHTLESSVLLEIINPANPDIHVCMTKSDFLSLAPRIWLTGASIDACSYVFNIREEEKQGNPRNCINYINWLVYERKKKDNINSIIVEREIDLEKAKDNPHYDTMKAEWLKDKEKMTFRDLSFFANKCGQLKSSWEKFFPNNNIRHADLIFVPTHLDNHFTVLVFIVQKSMIEDIDNRIDNKHFTRCGEKPYDRVHELAYTKNLVRCQLAIDLVSYKENRKKEQVLKGCALWSTMMPSLIQRQTIRKDKENHLVLLRAKRVEKVFEEDQKIRQERARHEQE
ncbi:hypothetical protein RDABS01_019306, partial [Bienertia sinuspersici]